MATLSGSMTYDVKARNSNIRYFTVYRSLETTTTGNPRRQIVPIKVVRKNTTLYVYLNTKLIKTIILSGSKYDMAFLMGLIITSNEDRYITLPEFDHDTEETLLSIYDLNRIISSRRIELIKSIPISQSVTTVRLIDHTLHQIHILQDRLVIESYDIKNDLRRILESSTGERIRISENGNTIGIYYNGTIEIFTPNGQEYRKKAHRIINQDGLELLDYIITDQGTIYYAIKNSQQIYHCVGISNEGGENRVLEKTESTDLHHPLRMTRIRCDNIQDLFVPDLDFFSKNGTLVRCQDVVILVDLLGKDGSNIVIRPIIEMDVNAETQSPSDNFTVTKLGTYYLDLSNNLRGDRFRIRTTDRAIVMEGTHESSSRKWANTHDLSKLCAPLVTHGISQLLRSEILARIESDTPKINRLANRLQIDTDSPKTIIIRSADDKDCEYQVTSRFTQHSIMITSIYEALQGEKLDNLIYQLTVNANMTLMDIRSFNVFENLLDGEIDPSDIIDKIFEFYPESSYDRYQTLKEIMDHIYDYTKFILLDIDLPKYEALDQVFSLHRKRLALLVAYIGAAMVLDYYSREVDLPRTLMVNNQIRSTTDFEITHQIAADFHHNFQPFKVPVTQYIQSLGI